MDQLIIHSKDLKVSHLPRKAATWQRIIQFASTFDPRAESPDGSKITGVLDISETSSIIDMRIALYIEWRRYNHFSSEPDSSTMLKVHNIIEKIRSELTK